MKIGDLLIADLGHVGVLVVAPDRHNTLLPESRFVQNLLLCA